MSAHYLPNVRTSKRIAEVLISAFRDGRVKLRGPDEISLRDLRFAPRLGLGHRAFLGRIWREYGYGALDGAPAGRLPEIDDELREVLSA